MKDQYFINAAFSNAIKLYIASSYNKDSLTYNSFLVIVIRILILIYGETDILNPYYLHDEVTFLNNLGKYGFSKNNIALFKEDFLNYYKEYLKNEQSKYQKPIPYFLNVVKYLIDMFILKKKNLEVSFLEEEKFLDLIYLNPNIDPYRYSYKYLMDSDNFIEKYYYSHLNELDVTRDLRNTIKLNLNLKALDYMGINLSQVTKMSNEELIKAQDKAYSYFNIAKDAPNRDKLLDDAINLLKKGKPKLTTGNGYVDILLLMSIIVTSFSLISIIILRI